MLRFSEKIVDQLIFEADTEKVKKVAYINHIVIKQQPKSVTLHNANVVAPVRAGPAVDHHGHQVVQAVRVDGVVRLEKRKAFRKTQGQIASLP